MFQDLILRQGFPLVSIGFLRYVIIIYSWCNCSSLYWGIGLTRSLQYTERDTILPRNLNNEDGLSWAAASQEYKYYKLQYLI